MAQIKYQQKANPSIINIANYICFIPDSLNQQYMKANQPKSKIYKLRSEDQNRHFAYRESQHLNLPQRQYSSKNIEHFQEGSSPPKYSIQREYSHQEKPVSSSQKITQKMRQQLTRKNIYGCVKNNSYQNTKERCLYRSNSPHINHRNNEQRRNDAIERIIDFRTKSFKLTSKKTLSSVPRYRESQQIKQSGQPETVSQKINRLRKIVDKNIPEDQFQLQQFHQLRSLMMKPKNTAKENEDKSNEISTNCQQEKACEPVKQYSSNQIYREVRRQYKKDEDQNDSVYILTQKDKKNKKLDQLTNKSKKAVKDKQRLIISNAFLIKKTRKSVNKLRQEWEEKVQGW